MEFNNIWTKEVNDLYRKYISEKKSMKEIRFLLGDKLNHHPKNKFKSSVSPLLTYESFITEIKFTPRKVEYGIKYQESYFFKGIYDIIIRFDINNTEYVLILDAVKENNILNDKIVYNVGFTTSEQYDEYYRKFLNIIKTKGQLSEKDYNDLKDIFEATTNYGDIISIFKAISYILIMISPEITKKNGYCIYMVGETDDERKITFYKNSIKDSFENYEIVSDYSLYNNNKLTYYYIIGD